MTGTVIIVLENYLTGRKQRVVINGTSSESFTVESGIPQGSVLFTLLFLIYIINDLERGTKSKVKLFAADLNQDLQLISL